MNKVLNIFRVLLTIIVVSIMFIFGFGASENYFIFVGLLFLIFWVGTSLMELIKKQNFNLKHNICSIIILLLVLIILLRPIFDCLIFMNWSSEFVVNGILTLYKEHIFYLWIICIGLFISNYVDYKIN